MQGPVESFRASFWWLLGYVLMGVGALGLPVVSLELVILATMVPATAGLTMDRALIAVGVAVAIGEAVAFLAVLALVSYFKVYVGPTGLSSYNSWCLYREVGWADILSAQPRNLLGLKSLRLHTAGARTSLFVPLFLRDQERFHQLVIQYAGPDHPLAIALHEDGH